MKKSKLAAVAALGVIFWSLGVFPPLWYHSLLLAVIGAGMIFWAGRMYVTRSRQPKPLDVDK